MRTTAEQPRVSIDASIDTLCVNAIRALAMDAVEEAGSGHPGAPMGLAPAAYVLWTRFLKHNPANPAWPDRDRFVLSPGHASMLLYALLHLTGYDLTLDDLRRFRQWGSRTPGHPERGPGVETTTGPLGQGLANAVGMALAERSLAERFNRPGFDVMSHRTWVIASDGDMMEGLSHEAAALAGHLGLRKLTVLYDGNGISIDGPTSLAHTEDVERRFEAYGWRVRRLDDGHDITRIEAVLRAITLGGDGPTLVLLRTCIGYGAPTKHGTELAHGAPLGLDEVRAAKRFLGWPVDPPFWVPDIVRDHMARTRDRGRRAEEAWTRAFDAYAGEHPGRANELHSALRGELPPGWDEALPAFTPDDAPVATRQASARVLGAIAPQVPQLLGGSADLTESTGTRPPEIPAAAFVHYGVREHAMGAIMNGLALHGGLRPYGGTFLVFSDYMRPPIRLASLMRLPVIFVFTHDSIALGEDGPTHQPVEQLASLRAIPGLVVIRPADARETVGAWRAALERRDGPTALVLTRQAVPVLAASDPRAVNRGAYVVRDVPRPHAGIVATGSEVSLALAAAELAAGAGVRVRVVSMPSWELFDVQGATYREAILPPSVPFLAVEAGSPLGWRRYAAAEHCLDRFGASAPGPIVMRELGFTPEAVAGRLYRLVEDECAP
jgi:transketolase